MCIYESLPALGPQGVNGIELRAQVFACTVGQKPSKAPFYLNDTSEVAHLLSRLADLGTPLPPPLPPSLMPIVQRPRRMQVDASS